MSPVTAALHAALAVPARGPARPVVSKEEEKQVRTWDRLRVFPFYHSLHAVGLACGWMVWV